MTVSVTGTVESESCVEISVTVVNTVDRSTVSVAAESWRATALHRGWCLAGLAIGEESMERLGYVVTVT
jgi:hypothetical protein